MKDENILLQEGEVLLKKRLNRRIRKCGGCSNPISDDPLEPPLDVCLMTKELRPKRGKSWTSIMPDDFVMANVHYHADSKCLNIESKIIIVSKMVNLNEYKTFLNKKGFKF